MDPKSPSFARYMWFEYQDLLFLAGPRQLFSGTFESSPNLHELFSNTHFLNIRETCSKNLPIEDLKGNR